MEQFEVIKRITLALQRTLAADLEDALGRAVPVLFAYDAARKPGQEQMTLVQVGLQRRQGNVDREYEAQGEGEQFRNPPLLLRAHYLLSAWATPPEDQVLIGAALRAFLDQPELALEGDDEEVVAYAGTPSVDLDTLTAEEHRALASALGMPFAPSVGYWVDFRLRSGKVTPIKRVRERVMDFRKIEG
ncbi:MAG: Pvc16 family protein [Planctomycetota bacterium]